MSKFNTTAAKPVGIGPIHAESVPSGRTFEGGPGYARDVKSGLFLLAVSNMVGEATFYESAVDRDNRYIELVHAATSADPTWTARFLRWLRTDGNMRSASLVGAAEFVRARIAAGLPGMSRQVIDSVLQRADEPGELLAYWTGHYGRKLPMAVKRGVADAAVRLYNERSLLKYDTDSKGFRFADVLELVHAAPMGGWQGDLFKHAIDRRHNREGSIPLSLRMLAQRAYLGSLPVAERRDLLDVRGTAEVFAGAGMTWEALAGWLQGPMDAKAWTLMIPSMGYMALLRNLRNFDEAGVSDEVAEQVAAKLADPEQVAKSRQFPYRFLSAYETAPSLRWGPALDKALRYSLRNLPTLPGRSLTLVDTSASMRNAVSGRSTMTAVKAAAVFGVALAAKNEQVDLIGFASGTFRHDLPKAASVIREVDRFINRVGEVGHGTDIVGSLRATYQGHDRVFVISDMQTIGGRYGVDPGTDLPANVPLYGFNLVGYEHAAYSAGGRNRHEFGGLTDATFRMVPLLEAGRDGAWPWEQ